jgi:hypothetical protein
MHTSEVQSRSWVQLEQVMMPILVLQRKILLDIRDKPLYDCIKGTKYALQST